MSENGYGLCWVNNLSCNVWLIQCFQVVGVKNVLKGVMSFIVSLEQWCILVLDLCVKWFVYYKDEYCKEW